MEILLPGSQGPRIYSVLGDALGDGLSVYLTEKQEETSYGWVLFGWVFLSAACIHQHIQVVQSAK